MIKHFFFFLFFLLCTTVFAEFSTTATQVAPYAQEQIDSVFVIKDLSSTDSLVYRGDVKQDYKWYAYKLDGSESFLKEELDTVLTSVPFKQETSIGYRLEIAGQPNRWVWVFDYNAYPVVLNNIQVNLPIDRCEYIQLNLGIEAEDMFYDTIGLVTSSFKVERQYEIRYDSTYYDSVYYVQEEVVRTIGQVVDYTIESPLDDTQFVLSGDQFAREFGEVSEVSTFDFQAVAIEIHPEGSVRIREDADNELNKDDSDDHVLTGSAPLNIEVLSNASPKAFFYAWCLSIDPTFGTCIVRQGEPDFRFVLEEAGTYYLQVEVSNNEATEDVRVNCNQTDMYTITVLESSLDVPNIFTPNGDGKNDLFKVAYRSIVDFECTIFNRWGERVAHFTDPAEGWDGYIRSKPASEGTYFYYITAVGDDEDEESEPVEYIKKGYITLLR